MTRPRSKTTKPTTDQVKVATDPSNHYIVYVHGICKQPHGFSIPWWNALRPWVQTIPDANRREVYWSDIVNRAPAAKSAKADAFRRELKASLADRGLRQLIGSSTAYATGGRMHAPEERRPDDFLFADASLQLEGLGFDCSEDIVKYFGSDSVRQAVLKRFDDVVTPLLTAGARVEIVAHSLGSVIAYEALCRSESGPSLPGVVHNLFTPGCPLAIPLVSWSLIAPALDGHKPQSVQTWINLNACFDVVGGPLTGNPFMVSFGVDHQFLHLPPVGCSPIIPQPVCADGSYFRPQNLLVNRYIFAAYIEA